MSLKHQRKTLDDIEIPAKLYLSHFNAMNKFLIVFISKTPHVVLLSLSLQICRQWDVPTLIFWPRYLDLWPRYPSTWPPCQNSCPYVCSFGHESALVVTDRQTDAWHVTDVGCKIREMHITMTFFWQMIQGSGEPGPPQMSTVCWSPRQRSALLLDDNLDPHHRSSGSAFLDDNDDGNTSSDDSSTPGINVTWHQSLCPDASQFWTADH